MHASRILLNAAKQRKAVKVPVEMYPLFAAVGVAVVSGVVFTYRHFAYDQQLRLWKNPNLSVLDQVLNDAAKQEQEAEESD